ncbi:hypothetical protein Zmor_012942 [Zophobas morio]|uniref:Uncharacterized protein n=1 Tax=Zophobas morio TaxID=2755281 RepID=A0AA38IEF8_9CUCU|nr:hypothetical protein Zmor_012942 [Zophobas morio]
MYYVLASCVTAIRTVFHQWSLLLWLFIRNPRLGSPLLTLFPFGRVKLRFTRPIEHMEIPRAFQVEAPGSQKCEFSAFRIGAGPDLSADSGGASRPREEE